MLQVLKTLNEMFCYSATERQSGLPYGGMRDGCVACLGILEIYATADAPQTSYSLSFRPRVQRCRKLSWTNSISSTTKS